jgi:hypothetical protein
MRENVTSTVTVNHAYPLGTHDRSSFDGEPRLVRRPPELPPTRSFDGDPKLGKRAPELPPLPAASMGTRSLTSEHRSCPLPPPLPTVQGKMGAGWVESLGAAMEKGRRNRWRRGRECPTAMEKGRRNRWRRGATDAS